MRENITLRLLPKQYEVVQYSPDEDLPTGFFKSQEGVVSWSVTPEEKSLICLEGTSPKGGKVEAGWRLLQFVGPFNFDEIGVLSSVLSPLAEANISIMAFSTYNTDYFMVKEVNLDRCIQVLNKTGFIKMLEAASHK